MIGTNALARSIPFVAIMAAAAYFYYLADNFDFPAMSGRAGPDLWPKIILGLMLLTCGIGIAKTLLARSTGDGSTLFKLLVPNEGDEGDTQPAKVWPLLALAGAGLFIAYVALLDRIGFVVCTAVLMASFLWLGRYRNPGVVVLASLAGSLGFFFVFRKLVYVSLPLGKEPFLSLSVWLMRIMGMS
jgi:putative tricarboxylic transport membrane protein